MVDIKSHAYDVFCKTVFPQRPPDNEVQLGSFKKFKNDIKLNPDFKKYKAGTMSSVNLHFMMPNMDSFIHDGLLNGFLDTPPGQQALKDYCGRSL